MASPCCLPCNHPPLYCRPSGLQKSEHIKLKFSYLPNEDTIAFAFVLDVPASVLTAILPREVALTVLLVVLPFSVVHSSIDPSVHPVALHLVVDEVSLEGTPVGPDEFTSAVLLSVAVLSLEDGPVRPYFLPVAMVAVVDPVPIVVSPIDMDVLASSVGAIVFPVTDVDVTVTMNDPPMSFLVIVHEVTIIAGAVRPDLATPTVSLSALTPLARVQHFLGQLHFVLERDGLSTCLLHVLAGAIAPEKVAELGQLLIDDWARVTRYILVELGGNGRAQVE